jgi:SAM-dependent methyltransferase
MDNQIKAHLHFLKHSIFKIESKWPQFKVMFDELESGAEFIASAKNVLILERCYFYGGYSLFKPLFQNANVKVVDCLNEASTAHRGAQSSWVDYPEFIKTYPDYEIKPETLSEHIEEKFDLVFIPNVIHHVQDQQTLFKQIGKVLAPGGKVLIFEGLVRELHHLPADYIRYTPQGIAFLFNSFGIKLEKTTYGSGVFDVIAYCMQMALEYFPDQERKKFSDLYETFLYPYLQELDAKYPKNIQKPDKHFPMSYVVWGQKNPV